jgi:DNA-binding response OmpR family regulator
MHHTALAGYTGRLLISAIPLSVGRDRAQECGADDYMQKPISTRALIDLFASLLMPAS